MFDLYSAIVVSRNCCC